MLNFRICTHSSQVTAHTCMNLHTQLTHGCIPPNHTGHTWPPPPSGCCCFLQVCELEAAALHSSLELEVLGRQLDALREERAALADRTDLLVATLTMMQARSAQLAGQVRACLGVVQE